MFLTCRQDFTQLTIPVFETVSPLGLRDGASPSYVPGHVSVSAIYVLYASFSCWCSLKRPAPLRSSPISPRGPKCHLYTGGSQIYALRVDGPAATAAATEGLSRLSASQFRLLLPKSYEVGHFITPAYEEETGLVTEHRSAHSS